MPNYFTLYNEYIYILNIIITEIGSLSNSNPSHEITLLIRGCKSSRRY